MPPLSIDLQFHIYLWYFIKRMFWSEFLFKNGKKMKDVFEMLNSFWIKGSIAGLGSIQLRPVRGLGSWPRSSYLISTSIGQYILKDMGEGEGDNGLFLGYILRDCRGRWNRDATTRGTIGIPKNLIHPIKRASNCTPKRY